MTATYLGEKRCTLVHEPSGTKIETDPPTDNQGKGERFSPTDLVGAALGSCILTTMALVGERDGILLKGAQATVVKEMIAQPTRRIGALTVAITLPSSIQEKDRKKLENAALHCPVEKSLHPDLKVTMTFEYR